MRRPLPSGNEHAFGHYEAQAHDILAQLRKFLMQIRHHPHDFLAENIKPQVPIWSGQHFSR